MAETELTVEQTELLTALRSALTSAEIAYTHEDAIAITDKLAECVIDLEWNEDTGALELVGIGGHYEGETVFRICQFPWQELDPFRQTELRDSVEHLIRRAHVVYHNAAADIKKLRQNRFAITVADHVDLDDTMLADAALNPELDHDLGDVGQRHGKLPPGYKALKRIAPREYNAGDLIEPLNIWRSFEKEFAKDPAAERVYREMSLAYLREIQIEQEEAGIRVDKRVPYVLRDLYAEKREQATRLAAAYVGGVDFNLGSPDDMKQFLYVVEALPEQREKAFGGVPGKLTTDKDAIANLRRGLGVEWDPEDEPTLDQAWANIEAGGHALLEARYLFLGAQQAISHYIDPCLVIEGTGDKKIVIGIKDRIFPEVRIHVQETGRHSYVGPALQQYKGPLDDEPLASGGRLPRLQRLICPDPGTVWIGHDWSNIETWLLGGLANDTVILEAKAKGWDTHTVNFCDITGTPYPPVLTKQLHTVAECATWRDRYRWQGDDDPRRTHSKRFVYRLHYLGKPENATDIPGSKALGFNAEKLVRASELYLARHPALPEYWAKVMSQAERYGVVYTFMGRPRRLTNPHRNARNREACNNGMQAGVGDIYVTTALAVKRAAPYARFVFGAHDSMWWQVPTERREEFRAIYRPIVEREFQLSRDISMSFPASYKEREAPAWTPVVVTSAVKTSASAVASVSPAAVPALSTVVRVHVVSRPETAKPSEEVDALPVIQIDAAYQPPQREVVAPLVRVVPGKSAAYSDFLASKVRDIESVGVTAYPDELPPGLYPFQAALTAWSLRKGRAALWADTGLGKTRMQVAWAANIPGRVLILTPLCVAPQTVREAAALGIAVGPLGSGSRIEITNYERLHHVRPTDYVGVVLDESSILKAFDGKTRTRLIEMFRETPYRLCCTATPAPNDSAELANHCEFLGVLSRAEMLATFFVHDEDGWRLKGHAHDAFYRWLASWGMFVRRPSDLGFDDTGYDLPPLTIQDVAVGLALTEETLGGIRGRQKARRESLTERVAAAAALVLPSEEQWIVWCGLNDEQDAIVQALPGAGVVSISGDDSAAEKQAALTSFIEGRTRVLVTKPKIAGFGLNLQRCHNMVFLGLGDSYESYYQSIRRCYRFGQTDPVNVYIVVSKAEGEIVENVRRKEKDAESVAAALVAAAKDAERDEIASVQRRDVYDPGQRAVLPAWLTEGAA